MIVGAANTRNETDIQRAAHKARKRRIGLPVAMERKVIQARKVSEIADRNALNLSA